MRNLAILFGGVSNLQIRVSALSSNRDFVTLTLWPICSLAGRKDEHRTFWRRIRIVALHVCVCMLSLWFKFFWRAVAQSRVQSLPIVVLLDEFFDVRTQML